MYAMLLSDGYIYLLHMVFYLVVHCLCVIVTIYILLCSALCCLVHVFFTSCFTVCLLVHQARDSLAEKLSDCLHVETK